MQWHSPEPGRRKKLLIEDDWASLGLRFLLVGCARKMTQSVTERAMELILG